MKFRVWDLKNKSYLKDASILQNSNIMCGKNLIKKDFVIELATSNISSSGKNYLCW